MALSRFKTFFLRVLTNAGPFHLQTDRRNFSRELRSV
jgi:hypothetical protein